VTRVVGLSGGIGSGKSTVARIFERLGARILDADAITRELQARGSPLLERIVEAFGAEVLTPEGELDRMALGERVFRDAAARERLEALVHPAVGAELARRLAAAREAGIPLVVVDVPLLFETAAARRLGFDALVLVWCRAEQQVERQLARDGTGREQAERRLRAQLPLDAKRALADFVIDNSDRIEDTERQVRELFERLSGGATRAARP
jgi:dephospho-CoA kinase